MIILNILFSINYDLYFINTSKYPVKTDLYEKSMGFIIIKSL